MCVRQSLSIALFAALYRQRGGTSYWTTRILRPRRVRAVMATGREPWGFVVSPS